MSAEPDGALLWLADEKPQLEKAIELGIEQHLDLSLDYQFVQALQSIDEPATNSGADSAQCQ